jgi:hypothetical protein
LNVLVVSFVRAASQSSNLSELFASPSMSGGAGLLLLPVQRNNILCSFLVGKLELVDFQLA